MVIVCLYKPDTAKQNMCSDYVEMVTQIELYRDSASVIISEMSEYLVFNVQFPSGFFPDRNERRAA